MQDLQIILDKIKEYLYDNVNLDLTIINATKKRNNNQPFTFDEHIRGMYYARISAGAKWYIIQQNKNFIDNVFFNFNKNALLNQYEKDTSYFYEKFKNNKCGIRFLQKSIESLFKNILIFEKIEQEYKSLDNYITSAPKYTILNELAEGRYKLYGFGKPLVAEYLRNVGVNLIKPDVHLIRILLRLGYIKNTETEPETIIKFIEKISKDTTYSPVEIDFLLWHLCADKYGEICREHPKCDVCPIKQFCKYNNRF
jgi:endonuclease III